MGNLKNFAKFPGQGPKEKGPGNASCTAAMMLCDFFETNDAV
jgi:hypothetical protein